MSVLYLLLAGYMPRLRVYYIVINNNIRNNSKFDLILR